MSRYVNNCFQGSNSKKSPDRPQDRGNNRYVGNVHISIEVVEGIITWAKILNLNLFDVSVSILINDIIVGQLMIAPSKQAQANIGYMCDESTSIRATVQNISREIIETIIVK